jgi:holo-[acyl-carrier protein] synthase
VDIVEVARVERAMEHHGDRFLRRLFTEDEIEHCRGAPREAEKYAARFAAKEAALKALRVGWQKGVRFRDLQIDINDMGAPSIHLSGRAREVAQSRGVTALEVSMSHERHYAVGQVIAVGD